MPNCITLWDALLADENRFEFLNFVCAYIIVSCRDVILKGDFAAIMECLQSEPGNITDVPQMLQKACQLKRDFLQKTKRI